MRKACTIDCNVGKWRRKNHGRQTNCDEKKEYVVKAYKREITVKGITFSYVHQTAYCSECGEELYCPQINDANVQAKEDAYRKAAKLITVEEVNQILEKYCIGAGPLAKVLGMGEITINRYVGGQLPSRENSAKLLDVLASPQLMEEHLESNKALISSTAYKKCRRALDKLLPLYGDQKYNKNSVVGEQIALFSYCLSFFHPITKELMEFRENIPNRKPFNFFKDI